MSKKKLHEEKMDLLQAYMTEKNITGLSFETAGDTTAVGRSNYIVEGQEIPFVIIVNDTVYTTFQVLLAPSLKEEKKSEIFAYANELNNQFSMLKYHLDEANNLLLTCSLPSSDAHFEPGLIFALVDEVSRHLTEQYSAIMKKIWG